MPKEVSGSSPEDEELKGSLEATDDKEGSSASDQDQDENGASSTSEDEGPKSTLEAVEAAIEKSAKEQSSSSKEDGQDADESANADADGKDKDGKSEGEDDGDKDLPPFHKHPRWIEVQGELKEARPKVKAFDQLADYMTEAGLSTEELNDGMEIMRLMKKDPLKAVEALQPYLDALKEAAGLALPADLADRLEKGVIDEDTAKELASVRQREAAAKAETEKAKEAAARQQASEQQSLIKDMQDGASAWEDQWKASDPDYAVLQPRVLEKIELSVMRMLQTGKFPKSVQEVRDICEACKKEVVEEMRPLRRNRREMRGSPNSGGKGTVKANPEPESTLDIIKMHSGDA